MKTAGMFAVTTLFALLVAAPVYAQQPTPTPDPHHGGAMSAPATHPNPAPTPDTKPMAMPMMEMCHQMMGDMGGMAMMGGDGPMGPKERAAMLEMRGEMMKVMGEMMMKHARRMQGMRGN